MDPKGWRRFAERVMGIGVILGGLTVFTYHQQGGGALTVARGGLFLAIALVLGGGMIDTWMGHPGWPGSVKLLVSAVMAIGVFLMAANPHGTYDLFNQVRVWIGHRLGCKPNIPGCS